MPQAVERRTSRSSYWSGTTEDDKEQRSEVWMTPELFGHLAEESLIPRPILNQAENARRHLEGLVKELVIKKKVPENGWPVADIELMLTEFARMDSNNFVHNAGVGEREARIYSSLVRRRHFSMGHGIGRSGDLCENQPKAAGSSVVNKVTNAMVLDLIRQLGVRSCKDAFVVPMATGMTLTLVMLALRRERPKAKYVIWSRIDQKSCFKCISSAGFEPIVLELIECPKTGELQTDLDGLRSKITEIGDPEQILCAFMTTSCFAPRAPDDLIGVAEICEEFDLPMLVNNAYGLQSTKCMYLLEESRRLHKLKHATFVQSTDKNLMVPVGGSIVAGWDKEWIGKISKNYPGRASSTPTVDVFATLLQIGMIEYKRWLKLRKENFDRMKEELNKLGEKYGENVIQSKNNTISIAFTLGSIPDPDGTGKGVTEVGSYLFTRGVSGTRVITGKDVKIIDGHEFKGWGSHKSTPCTPYLTAAAAVGMMWKDRDSFIDRLDKVLKTKKSGKKQLRKEIQREMKLPPSGQHVKIIKEHVGLLDDSFEPEDDPKDGETGLEDVIEDPVNERRETDADSKAAGDMETETIKK